LVLGGFIAQGGDETFAQQSTVGQQQLHSRAVLQIEEPGKIKTKRSDNPGLCILMRITN